MVETEEGKWDMKTFVGISKLVLLFFVMLHATTLKRVEYLDKSCDKYNLHDS